MIPDDKVISTLRRLLVPGKWSDESVFPLIAGMPSTAKDSFGLYARDFAVTVSADRLILVFRSENEEGLPRFTVDADMSGDAVSKLYEDLSMTTHATGKRASDWARKLCYETVANNDVATADTAGRHWSEHDRLEMPDSFDSFILRSKSSQGDGESWVYDNGVTDEHPGHRFQQIRVSVASNKHVSIGVFTKDGRQTKATVLNRDNMSDDGPNGVIAEINSLLRSSLGHRAEATASASSLLTLHGIKHVVVAYDTRKPGHILENPTPLDHQQRMAEMSRQSRIEENNRSKVYKRADGRLSVSPSKPSDATEVADIPPDNSPLWHDGKPDMSLVGPVLSVDRSSFKSITTRDEDKARTQNWSLGRDGWSRVARWVDLADLSFTAV